MEEFSSMQTGDEVDEAKINWRAAKDRARAIIMSVEEARALVDELDDPLATEFDQVQGDVLTTDVAGYILIKVVP
jgi:hypothetical protein